MTKRNLHPTYEELREKSPLAASLITQSRWDGVHKTAADTVEGLDGLWNENIEANLKSAYWSKHMRANELTGLGTNKAVIAVGAGPSLKKNEDVLKSLSDMCISQHLDAQPFIIVASNHMYKPLLDKGIYPHFVMLIDASDATYDQLCTDIPKNDKTILIAPLQIHPRIAEAWSKQGRPIVWCLAMEEEKQKLYRELTGEDPQKIAFETGGNVLNCIWSMSARYLRSTVFMCVGNDLSFDYDPSLSKRRRGYYATGDYEINIRNQRDEAQQKSAWMRFNNLHWSETVDVMGRASLAWDFEPAYMSFTLFSYKTWCESQVMLNVGKGSWHFYNCSEQGTLGVMSRSEDPEEMKQDGNWYLLDEHPEIGKHYHTRKLEDAAWEFLQAKEELARSQAEVILSGANMPGVII